ncbi:phosphoethanolamine transferase [Veillonella sp.]|uniref:phosphoethanolamine transferase n=1 Tax=Veillonella sp. TaxID=1926307 RepID=UPI0025CBA271|nr:phosphoethanolamine transferase [Veillonella sp.]
MKPLSFWWRNAILQAALWCILIFAVFYYIYEPITLGFDWEDVTLLAIPSLLGLALFQQLIRSTLWHRVFLGHGLLGLSWALTYPLLYHWSYTKPFYFYEFFPDFLFGALLFMGLSLIHYFIVYHLPYRRRVSVIMALIQWLLSIIPLIQIGYYINTWHCLTPATLMALYQTNPEEAFGFLKSAGGVTGLIAMAVGAILLFAFYYWSNEGMSKLARRQVMTKFRLGGLSTVCLACAIYLPFGFYETDIVRNWCDVATYMKELQQYSEKHQAIYSDLQLTTKETAAQKVPGTVILVIGESSSRNYMKVYNPNFEYDDTPWQSEMAANNPNFVFFRNAYSSYVQTVPTLERALTERNQYDDKPFLESASILDVAKKAGYFTSWFSNQGVYGEYDTAISLIAKTADRPLWAHEAYMFSDKYDGVLLPLLDQIEPYKNNFIVIHIMGSHIYYNDRYPHEFSKWKVGEVPQGKEAYANSQLYTDWLLQQIYTYGKNKLNLQAMIYFSDHGESLHHSHNPDIFDFDMTRIPLWVYVSPEYEAAYPETTSILRDHERKYFTNDLLYDLVAGILQAPSNRYDRSRDFSNPNYRFDKYNLTTLLGQEPLTNDPEAVDS